MVWSHHNKDLTLERHGSGIHEIDCNTYEEDGGHVVHLEGLYIFPSTIWLDNHVPWRITCYSTDGTEWTDTIYPGYQPPTDTMPLVLAINTFMGTNVFGMVGSGDDSARVGNITVTMILLSALVMVGFRGNHPVMGVIVAMAVVYAAQYVGILTAEMTVVTWLILGMLGLAGFLRTRMI